MKIILTSALFFVGVAVFAQSTGAAQPAPQANVVVQLSPKAKALCKVWSLSQTENFGDVHKPTDQQKGDLLNLMEGGRYRLIMDGVAEGGTWVLSKDNLWITVTTDAGAIKKFKIIESTDSALKVDYRDADDIHNILYYSAGTTSTPQQK